VVRNIVCFVAIPSQDEIVRLYKAGELSAELTRYHGTADGEADQFIKSCIALHNSGNIDLVSLPSQPAFADATGHAFFTVQHFYCEAIPKLDTNAAALMECCRILIEQAGADLAGRSQTARFALGARTIPMNAPRSFAGRAPEISWQRGS
jgi:hypothetical protein